jgi:hypothetical protein
MGTFNFTLPNGKPFEIKGPPGLSLEQAKAVFDKQAETGSLVGIKPGGVLSAATQAAQGLPGAQALLAQAQSGITGALGAGIPGAVGDIGSLTKSLGAAGGALAGSLNGIAPGLSGAVGVGAAKDALTSVSTLGATASSAITNINKTIAGTALTDPVNIADFAKQAPALTAIQPLTQPETTGLLAQAKKLVNQGADVLSSEKGLGAFGLGADQLEKAGILKPGMSKFVKSGASTLANMLKSPAAFTGKDGIKSADDLLASLPKQELIQQDLMKQGLDGLKALGVPPLALSAVGAAGAALNSAISPEQAANFLKGIPVVGDNLAEKFTANTRDGAFATILAKDKIPPAFKAEVTPAPAGDTVNRDTVNAASARVVGNPKVPEPNYGPSQPIRSIAEQNAELKSAFDEVVRSLESIESKSVRVEANLSALEMQATVTETEFDAINSEFEGLRFQYLAQSRSFARVRETFDSSVPAVQLTNRKIAIKVQLTTTELASTLVDYKNRIAELSKKREGPAPVGAAVPEPTPTPTDEI